ncbi:MAG: TonB-dependent receptor domain-containing protein, partial [Flavobacteriales bacterium]
TGKEEANAAIQLEKKWNKNWFSSLYFSTFNAEIGVLRGSHIGNLTDLEDALEREVPFFTEDKFSYEYESPYQRVNHHLVKFNTHWNITELQSMNISFAGQYNLRKEFDVRRGGRSNIPALSIEQVSNFVELKYQNQLSRKWKMKSGVQLNRTDNVNLPGTGILPLIPDYISQELGYFLTFSKVHDKTQFDFGGRADFENRNVASISAGVPREVIRYSRRFQNFGAMVGLIQQLNDHWKIGLNSGYAVRNPEVNELYSNGLHQGVSGIEEGDPFLNEEASIKTTLSLKGEIGKKCSIQALFYHQQIDDFIFLNPQEEVRLTIRGAFPVFKYEQSNAQLIGFDFSGDIEVGELIDVLVKYSYLRGKDQTKDIPLVNMPANSASVRVELDMGKHGRIEQLKIQANGRYTFEQKNLLASQDFVAPPEGYFLLGAGFSGEIKVKQHSITVSLRGENILNERFRDYLNRQRYFADGQGLNLIAGIQFAI